MGRVYFIFHNPSPSRKRRSIQDWHLLLIILGLACIDIIIATVALAIDPYKPREVDYREQSTGRNEFGILIDYRSLVCQSDRSLYWIVVLFLTKFIVQAAAVFFAFKTRKVKIKVLNDAKLISIIIYVSSGLLTIMLIAAVSLSGLLNTDAAVFGSGLVIVPTVVLLLLFVPKWYTLYKDPRGDNIFEGNGQPSFSSMLGGGISEQDAGSMASRIEELEERLAKYEHVTPSQPRKRFLSSAAGGSTTAFLNRPGGGIRGGGRSQSFSPGPLDTTASLPARMLNSPAPLSPLGVSSGNTFDSGAGTMTSESGNNSPDTKKPRVTLVIQEADETDNSLLSSQTPLTTATTNF